VHLFGTDPLVGDPQTIFRSLEALLFLVKLHYSTGSFGGDSICCLSIVNFFLSGTHKYSFAQSGILCTGQNVKKRDNLK
jgi:hypothetical protein